MTNEMVVYNLTTGLMLNIRCYRELVNLESFVQNIASCLSLLCVLCQGLFSIA